MFLVLAAAGAEFWMLHANAWGLGSRSPVLGYDAAEYAVAARELARHGQWVTTYALPVELARHATPPWPLALVQPGMVVTEAALFQLAPPDMRRGHDSMMTDARRPDQMEWLVLVLPFVSFIVIAVGLGLAVSHVLRRFAPNVSIVSRVAAGTVIGLAFLADPEAQHFAIGGFTELPFTLGLVGALAALALGIAPRLPFALGLLLGVTGTFRGAMLWLAPIFALGAAAAAPAGRRGRTLLLVLAGYAIPLAPWWIYKWRNFGTPAWDLSARSVWDGVQGRTWFSLFNDPDPGGLPHGLAGARLLAAKVARNLPSLALDMLNGPRALFVGALALWAWVTREPRGLRAAAWTALALAAASVFTAALSVPQLRYLFPTRVLVEAAGLLAVWGLIARADTLAPRVRAVLAVGIALLTLGWGARQCALGLDEARRTSEVRGVPTTLTLLQISRLVSLGVPAGEPVMSNLGPILAWESRRAVIHLAESPDLVAACRRRVDFSNVILAFRDARAAWPEWRELIEHPNDAMHHPGWNIRQLRVFQSADGFQVVWLELKPLEPSEAALVPASAP
jgi:hypothetical protein